jgi:Fe(3+) dicitrate transport protein
LLAERSALGAINTVNDPGGPRNYRTDAYKNWGNESRLIYSYNTQSTNPFVLLGGLRYYDGYTDRQIGLGNAGSGGAKSDFAFDKSNEYDSLSYSRYTFPNHNVAFFAENIFRIGSKLSIIPGAGTRTSLPKQTASTTIPSRTSPACTPVPLSQTS